MHLPIRLATVAALGIIAGSAVAQDNAVVLFDATHKTTFCVVSDMSAITPGKACANFPVQGFLVQGQRNQLRVINRKFLTNYTFFIDKVTKVQNFPIEALEEASNLTTPIPSAAGGVSKGAAPKGLATSGALALRTAQDLLAELLNPATSSNPVNEISSDWIIVKREAENVRTDAIAFQRTWNNINGDWVHGDPCLRAYGAPTLTSAAECLRVRNHDEWSGTFANGPPYSDEDRFRKLIVNDNDAIAMVTSLGNLLAQRGSVLTNQLSSFDGDLALLRADMNTLAGNVQAIQDAKDLADSITPEMTQAQIKARLMQTLNGGTKPVLDDAELNRLTDDYYSFIRTGAGKQELDRAKSAIELLWGEGIRQTQEVLQSATALAGPDFPKDSPCPDPQNTMKFVRLGCLADRIDARYSFVLQHAHMTVSDILPTKVAKINVLQSKLLARANEIYDNSRVTVPLDKAIDLGGNTGNLRVYFTIYETETFSRFAMPASSSAANPVVAATPATITTSPPPPAATTTATATTATTTTAPPSGTPVTSGVIEVHDRYKATMVAAFAFSTIKETSIQTKTISTGKAEGSVSCTTAATCTQVTVSPGPTHSSVIVGVSYHPWGYDTFPGAYSWKRPTQALKQGAGIFGGLSVQNLNDYYAGADMQIAHGLQIMGGVNFFRQNTLAAGFMSGGIYSGSPIFTGPQHWSHGGYFGIGLNLSIFRKAFGSVTGLGTKVASSGS